MANISNFLDKYIHKIIIIILLFNPFLDILTSIFINVFKINFTIGMIYKTVVLFAILYYYFFCIKNKSKKTSNIFILCIIFYFLINIIYHLMIGSSFKNEFVFTFKSFYFPMFLILVWNICEYKKIDIKDKYLYYTVCIYALTIFVAYITGTSFKSYDVSKIGAVGWFNSANEVGNIVAICLPICISYVFKSKKIVNYLLFLLILLSIIIMGTKTPILSLIICFIYYYIKVIIQFIKNKKYKLLNYLLFSSFLLIGITILCLPMVPFYKNLIIHLEYLNIHSFNDFFNIKLFDHFFLGSRLMFLKNTSIVWLNSDIISYLFGIGIGINSKLIEMDLFDIFFRFGIIGLIVYIIPIIYLLKHNKVKNNNYLISIILILFISLIVGHVLIKPSVSIVVSVIIIKYLRRNDGSEKI